MPLCQVRARPGSSSIAASCSVDTTIIVWDLTKVGLHIYNTIYTILSTQSAMSVCSEGGGWCAAEAGGAPGLCDQPPVGGGRGPPGVSLLGSHSQGEGGNDTISYPLLQVWDTARGKQLHSLDRHREPVTRYCTPIPWSFFNF